jgi:thiamine-monophosphate kinase
VGGDITKWKRAGALVLCTTALGRSTVGKPITRSGARVGDRICVTGSLGGSRSSRHLEFTPRVAESIRIAKKVPVHAMIDISDGLSTDLNRLCRHSGVGAIVEAAAIPVSEAASETKDPLSAALNDGEDFELLFTLSPRNCEKLLAWWNEPAPITEIGRITDTGKVRIRGSGDTYDLPSGGYDHLSG